MCFVHTSTETGVFLFACLLVLFFFRLENTLTMAVICCQRLGLSCSSEGNALFGSVIVCVCSGFLFVLRGFQLQATVG